MNETIKGVLITMENELYDVTIIGGGPAGLYSAFYSGLREMKTKIIEFQPKLGGKLNVYPEKIVWDVGGVPPVPAERLIDQIVEQGMSFHPEVVLNEKITSISNADNGNYRLEAENGNIHYSRTVIIAVGSGILRPQKLKVQGADRFELTNLHYTIQSLKAFKNKRVLISGGGNSAVDWANELAPIAEQVYLTYRKDQLKGHEAQITQLNQSNIQCMMNTEIRNLIASSDHREIEEVELYDHAKQQTHQLDVDLVLVNHGFEQDASLLDNSSIQVERKDGFFVSGNSMSESSVEGIYAAGDILSHDGKLNLIAGAFQDAANAVNKAKTYIEPEAESNAMVSSHNSMFKDRNKRIVDQYVNG
ncbi:NAD(P)/FAD-dependent oxidoreductase [Halobacillus yeomjeoni]|uniref:NAD(P)/FAD-dependent oxidoreductase n=1 Tax=Halobacillus yeomjeoni TaxID=311194 RepID=UPI001CD4E4C5|nr:NAD(P)/FAD-dependent oxidoreductase [Halobacillus yeomjeoni]MCA0983470.1 NAD(P)/FAD-dependent oxidoreductase [Halobacillus yeomjeoni]